MLIMVGGMAAKVGSLGLRGRRRPRRNFYYYGSRAHARYGVREPHREMKLRERVQIDIALFSLKFAIEFIALR